MSIDNLSPVTPFGALPGWALVSPIAVAVAGSIEVVGQPRP
jgi:hypothetical protein